MYRRKTIYSLAGCLFWGCNPNPLPHHPIPPVAAQACELGERFIEARVSASYWEGYSDGMQAQSLADHHEVIAAVKSRKGIQRFLDKIGKERFALVGDYPNEEELARAEVNKLARHKHRPSYKRRRNRRP